MDCRSAAWVLGGVRLISSARMTLAKIGPRTKRNTRRPVVRSSSRTSEPVMSEGIRSGVNWMRPKDRSSTSARVWMSMVLARPGTPTKRQWPRENRAIKRWSMTSCCPMMRLPISAHRALRAWQSSRAAATSRSTTSGVGRAVVSPATAAPERRAADSCGSDIGHRMPRARAGSKGCRQASGDDHETAEREPHGRERREKPRRVCDEREPRREARRQALSPLREAASARDAHLPYHGEVDR